MIRRTHATPKIRKTYREVMTNNNYSSPVTLANVNFLPPETACCRRVGPQSAQTCLVLSNGAFMFHDRSQKRGDYGILTNRSSRRQLTRSWLREFQHAAKAIRTSVLRCASEHR